MFAWICANQIAGSADLEIPEANWPEGFTLVEVPEEADIDDLYWDGAALVPKPSAPSSEHVWDGALREWVVPVWP